MAAGRHGLLTPGNRAWRYDGARESVSLGTKLGTHQKLGDLCHGDCLGTAASEHIDPRQVAMLRVKQLLRVNFKG